jgi:hypothetical protein
MGAQSFHNDALRGMEANGSDAPQVENVSFVSISAEERAKMDALTAEALQKIFAEYATLGIDNAEAIYNAMNQ